MAAKTVARGQILRGQTWEELRARAGSLGYREGEKRDLRLDFLRGLAVSAMVVDHVGGDTFLTTLSGGNQAIVSAAEAFVFLSGLVLGMVYAERIARSGPSRALRAMLHRALTLYKASAGVALFFVRPVPSDKPPNVARQIWWPGYRQSASGHAWRADVAILLPRL